MAEHTSEYLSPVPDMRLELVPVPVTDVDRAKAFYTEKAGFTLEVDVYPREGMRVVQLTPPGSACSIVFGAGMGELTDMTPGSVRGLHLVVVDIQQSREALRKRGLEVGDVTNEGGVLYAEFRDPDGNLWLLQEFPPDIRLK
jgi:catechol 2,3-dioxygenase-like lactoylglutathione lyase family enzyme